MVRCTSLNSSAWSKEKKHMRRYKGNFDIFFGVEHRMRKEEMEEQFNKDAKQGWRFAADSARNTDEKASSEDRKHSPKEEGAVTSIPRNQGRIVQTWCMCEEVCESFPYTSGTRHFMKRVSTTRHPRLIACDANMCPKDFEKRLWLRSRHMFIKGTGEGD